MPEKSRNGKKRISKAQRRRIQRQKRIIASVLGTIAVLLIGGIVWMLSMALGEREDVAQVPPVATVVPAQEPAFTAEPTATVEPTAVPTPTPEPEPVYITLTAVGDCTLGGNTNSGGDGEERFAACFEQNGADYFLENVRSLFESDDVTVANLEGPLTTATEKRSKRQFNFRGDPQYVNILSGSGVEVCNLANNHAYDFKTAGFDETAQALEAAGVGACGFGLEHYMQVKGYTLGFLGFTEWDFEANEIESAIRSARQKCDLLIVCVHWGEELTYKQTKNADKLGRMMVDAGADLVIGGHSHVYGEIEQYQGKYIIYSLGNFCFGGNKKPTDMNCIIFQQRFCIQPDGSVEDAGINLIPARVSSTAKANDFKPCFLEGDAATELLEKVAKVSKLTEENTVWMPESYVVEHQIVTADAKIGPTVDVGSDASL